MGGAIHPLPQYAFMAWCLVKAQGHLYLLLKYFDFLLLMREAQVRFLIQKPTFLCYVTTLIAPLY